MRFNQNQSYQWVSQPRRFAGQTMDWNISESAAMTESKKSMAEPPLAKRSAWSDFMLSLQSIRRRLLQEPQNL